ncbi:MAG: hypothetical protein EXR50_02365 [Dehalococcoidia bacterium]|nr:hypothetical protein [Dehalococcoidia bacterium]
MDDRLVISDKAEVDRLLDKEPGLAVLVDEAIAQLINFIPDAHLRLEFLTDPDYEDGEQLFLGVSTRLQDDQALEALHRFDQEWWVNHVHRAHGLLCIDLSNE